MNKFHCIVVTGILGILIIVNPVFGLDPTDYKNMLELPTQQKAVIQVLESELSRQPKDPFTNVFLGLAYLKNGYLDNALDIWQKYETGNKKEFQDQIKHLLSVVQYAENYQFAAKTIADEKDMVTKTAQPDTVAVFNFTDLSMGKSLQTFQKGMAVMITTDLAKAKQFKVIERMRLKALLDEMGMGKTGLVDKSSAVRAGKLLGVENLIIGNMTLGQDNMIESVVSVASSSSENIKATAKVTIDQAHIYDLPQKIVSHILQVLNVSLSKEEENSIMEPHTQTYDAFVSYCQGINALDDGDLDQASALLNRSVSQDPNFDLAVSTQKSLLQKFETYSPDLSDLYNVDYSSKLEQDVLSETKLIVQDIQVEAPPFPEPPQ